MSAHCQGQCGLGSKRCYWSDRAAPHPRCTPGTFACPYPPVNMAAATNSTRECRAACLQYFFSGSTVDITPRLSGSNPTLEKVS